MHFQVFIPGDKSLEAVGLGDLSPGINVTNIGDGPGKLNGKICYWPNQFAKEWGYKPEVQTWIPAVAYRGLDPKRYYVGFWNDKLPTPNELKREKTFEGREVVLGDKRSWIIPAAARLPSAMKYNEDGELEFHIRKEFREFWDESQSYWLQFVVPEVIDSDIVINKDWMNYLHRALRLNYRVTPEVVSHLELFDQHNACECVHATLDHQNLMSVVEALKKNNLTGEELLSRIRDISDSSDGETD